MGGGSSGGGGGGMLVPVVLLLPAQGGPGVKGAGGGRCWAVRGSRGTYDSNEWI